MADGLDLQDIVKRTAQANARFYKGWLDLSLDYFRGIAEIFGGESQSAHAADDLDDGAGALVMEGEEGAAASSAFLVTNDLGRKIHCVMVATDFKDADGNAIRATTTFEPGAFDLGPGQQCVVRATVPIDSKLTAGVAYAGEFAIKGMDGFSVAAVVRRRHGIEASPIDRVAATAAQDAGKRTTRKTATRGAGQRSAAKKSAPKKQAAKRVAGSAPKKRARKGTPKKK